MRDFQFPRAGRTPDQAERLIDKVLAQGGMSRSERRRTIADLKALPIDGEPAGEDVAALFQPLIQAFKGETK